MQRTNEGIVFYVLNRNQPGPSATPPYVVLSRNNWDDYHYKTTFGFTYFGLHNDSFSGHQVKILDRKQNSTLLENQFQQLGSDYCSLGQDLQYYQDLAAIPTNLHRAILRGLNDVVYNEDIRHQFQGLDGFQQSLIRFSEAEKALKEAPALFAGQEDQRSQNDFRFTFQCQVTGATEPHRMEIDFTPRIPGLHRIVAFIGKNGTGKTQVLANLASSLSGWRKNAGAFEPERPAFSKVMALSYSFFDRFDTPPEGTETYSYKYCGVRRDAKYLGEAEIRSELERAHYELIQRGRVSTWQRMIQTVLGSEFPTELTRDDLYGELSAGQRLLLLLLTQVIANIEKESIILFDEPETHLHPEALSSVIQALHVILEEYSSYSIIATHSPIVLQEIPSRSVRVFRRIGNAPLVSGLEIESFGENLTTISNEVFESREDRHSYRAHLRKLLMGRTLDEVSALFDDNLSLNAMSYLATFHRSRNHQER